jgi:hypothetical protein
MMGDCQRDDGLCRRERFGEPAGIWVIEGMARTYHLVKQHIDIINSVSPPCLSLGVSFNVEVICSNLN